MFLQESRPYPILSAESGIKDWTAGDVRMIIRAERRAWEGDRYV
jgi:hypothetical protein